MSSSHGRRRIESEAVGTGFQIAPMIDVVFVIMLFFMVMANSVKVEHELKTVLPGPPSGMVVDTSEELRIEIADDGAVLMNDEEYDSASDTTLPALTASLIRLKKDADFRNERVVVTLQTEEQARYERIIQVMNALAAAKIAFVTFTIGSEGF
ncbi:biopolymer transporter ExbD [Verrucomicrobium sp. BvORR106]|uniref:ExbD/TolR family protein n=1 Tax=Verrucomicrobium sp. BvORR106 TaxID=1403819 RepID=UPI00069217FE|nr:biopolymer transporter ExbD [Verrucomicrobium sp. BvORR106]